MTELIEPHNIPFAKHYRHAANLYKAVMNDLTWHLKEEETLRKKNKEQAVEIQRLHRDFAGIVSNPKIKKILEDATAEQKKYLEAFEKVYNLGDTNETDVRSTVGMEVRVPETVHPTTEGTSVENPGT